METGNRVRVLHNVLRRRRRKSRRNDGKREGTQKREKESEREGEILKVLMDLALIAPSITSKASFMGVWPMHMALCLEEIRV